MSKLSSVEFELRPGKELHVQKFEGAGNDFVLIDDRTLSFSSSDVPRLCHRKFGIGADGVILLQNDAEADFQMRIYNSNGSEAESCGNGLRCFLQFILELGFPKKSYRIRTLACIVEADFFGDRVRIKMGNPQGLRSHQIDGKEIHFVDTGVPHAIVFVPDVEAVDIDQEGAFLRHHPVFQPRGANVNFAALQSDGSLRVRTFERGVEGETLACGTGAAAVGAIAGAILDLPSPIQTHFRGGPLEIHFTKEKEAVFDLQLVGFARKVFSGIFFL